MIEGEETKKKNCKIKSLKMMKIKGSKFLNMNDMSSDESEVESS